MKQIHIARIRKPPKTRPINDAAIKAIMESFDSAGQISPIILKHDRIVFDRKEEGYLLIAGNHRLEAAKRLGWESIGAEVYDDGHNAVHLELIEVDENLCRAELTAAEKAAALKKRKILWESLKEQHPGGNLVSTRRPDGTFQKGDEKEKGFATSTAEVTGMSKQAINEYIRIADQLGDLLDDIQGTELDSKPKLQELVKLGQEARMAIIQDVMPKMAKDAMSAISQDDLQKTKESSKNGQNHKPATRDPEKMVERFVKQFHRLPPEHQLLVWESLKVMFEDDD